MSTTYLIIKALISLTILAGIGCWLCVKLIKNSENPRNTILKMVFSVFFLWLIYVTMPTDSTRQVFVVGRIMSVVMFCMLMGRMWTAEIAEFFADSFTSFFTGGNIEPEAKAHYSIAHARRKQGKYQEALTEIRYQLDAYPNDFEGMMLQAEIQAEELHDLESALVTLELFLAGENLPPEHVCYALNLMTDWHLKYSLDVAAARASQERIIQLYPDTPQAHKAHQRIAHLGTQEMLLQKHERRRITVPTQGDVPPAAQEEVEEDPVALAARYVKQLEEHPRDNDAREQLAILYARRIGQLDLARDQLEQLIQHPHQSVRDVVHWLNLLATLEIEAGVEELDVRTTLLRIIDSYPDNAAAAQARSRLERLGNELRDKGKSQAIKLGSYEKDLGLKRRLT